MQTMGPCALCGTEGPLEQSHLIPKFVGRRLAKDSGTPYFRGEDPNLRLTDSKRLPLLDRSCEQRFGVAENAFATAYYHPTRDNIGIEIPWTNKLAKFVASITWRNLMLTFLEHRTPTADWTAGDWEAMEMAEVRLRSYLNGKSGYPTELEHHVFSPGDSMVTEHDGLNMYLNSAMLNGIPATDEAVYSVVLIPGVVIIALLAATDEVRSRWRAGTLASRGGTLKNHGQRLQDGVIGNYFLTGVEAHRERHKRLAPEERELLAREARMNPMASPTANSPLARARRQDAVNRLGVSTIFTSF